MAPRSLTHSEQKKHEVYIMTQIKFIKVTDIGKFFKAAKGKRIFT